MPKERDRGGGVVKGKMKYLKGKVCEIKYFMMIWEKNYWPPRRRRTKWRVDSF